MMARYPATMSKDGEKRVSFTVPARFTLDELATFITADKSEFWSYKDGEKIVDRALIRKTLTSRTAAIAAAGDAILYEGTMTPAYRVGDDNLEAVKGAVLERLNELWAD